jgi:hypothetical protein
VAFLLFPALRFNLCCHQGRRGMWFGLVGEGRQVRHGRHCTELGWLPYLGYVGQGAGEVEVMVVCMKGLMYGR